MRLIYLIELSFTSGKHIASVFNVKAHIPIITAITNPYAKIYGNAATKNTRNTYLQNPFPRVLFL